MAIKSKDVMLETLRGRECFLSGTQIHKNTYKCSSAHIYSWKMGHWKATEYAFLKLGKLLYVWQEKAYTFTH